MKEVAERIKEVVEEEEDTESDEYLKQMDKAFSILEKSGDTQVDSYFKRAEESWIVNSGLDTDEDHPFSSPNADAAVAQMKKDGTYMATMRPIAVKLFAEDVKEDSSVEVKPIFKKKPYVPKSKDPAPDEESGPSLYRLADKEEGDYTLEELDEIKTWWSNKFPNIPLETVEGLIDGKAWGKLLKSARVLISTSAAEGTGYHEAWHVWNLLFNDEKSRKDLYDEARKRTGKDMTDKQAEEFLADEFMDI